jgi:hypothetical protein
MRRRIGADRELPIPINCLGNEFLTLTNYFLLVGASRADRADRISGTDSGEIMRTWLESDAVALLVLVFGLVAVELLAFNI